MIAAELKGQAAATSPSPSIPAPRTCRTMAAEGRARGLELPLTERAAQCFEEASRSGWGGPRRLGGHRLLVETRASVLTAKTTNSPHVWIGHCSQGHCKV